jgi:RHS repeat-associated protein
MTTSIDMKRSMTGLLLTLFAMLAGIGHARAQDVVYYHTDALGTPVALTDSSGTVIERREVEPYGRQLSPTGVQDGPNFTGHVADAATGLDYMQQRYYDPVIGRFLSRDAVTAYDSGDMRHFNAYDYAYNNPYRFTDPDGRCPKGEACHEATPFNYYRDTLPGR